MLLRKHKIIKIKLKIKRMIQNTNNIKLTCTHYGVIFMAWIEEGDSK